MTIELLGVAGWTIENKQFYEKKLLARAVPSFVYTGWGIQRQIPARGGNSIEFRRLERPSAATTALTQGTPPTEIQTTWTNVAATVVQYGAYVKFSDVAAMQSIDEVLDEHITMFGEHAADTIDQIARDVLVAGTNVQFADAAGSRAQVSRGNVLDEAEIREAVRELKRRNAKPIAKAGNKFVMITHMDAIFDLLGDTTIQNVLQNAGMRGESNPLFSGQMFDYLGVKILETSNCKIVSGAGLSGDHVYLTQLIADGYYGETGFGPENVEVIVTPVNTPDKSDPLHQYGTVGWKVAKAFVRLNEAFGQRIEHGTAKNSAT